MFLKSLLFLSAPLIQFWLRREEGSFNYVKYPSSFFKTQVAREIFVEIVVGEAVEVRSRAFVCCCRQPLATIVFGSFSNVFWGFSYHHGAVPTLFQSVV